jgi:hypothetical protein
MPLQNFVSDNNTKTAKSSRQRMTKTNAAGRIGRRKSDPIQHKNKGERISVHATSSNPDDEGEKRANEDSATGHTHTYTSDAEVQSSRPWFPSVPKNKPLWNMCPLAAQ